MAGTSTSLSDPIEPLVLVTVTLKQNIQSSDSSLSNTMYYLLEYQLDWYLLIIIR